MSSPVNLLRHGAAIAAMVLFGASGAAASGGDAAAALESVSVEFDAVDGTAAAMFGHPLVGHAEDEPAGVHEGDRIDHGDAARDFDPVKFTGIVGRYLTLRSPVPADYLETVRVHEPDPWVGRFTGIW